MLVVAVMLLLDGYLNSHNNEDDEGDGSFLNKVKGGIAISTVLSICYFALHC